MMIVDIIGSIGVASVVYAYYLLQVEKVTVKDIKYSVLNAAGSVLILISLVSNFNFASCLIESFWLLISIYGVIHSVKNK